MTRTARSALIALALCTAVPRALAQDEVVETREREDAETAFLRAYYLELGQQDYEGALDAYRQVLDHHRGSGVEARTWLGMARTLKALGRHEEARKALDGIGLVNAVGAHTLKAARLLRDSLGATGGDDELTSLVLRALREEAWLSKTSEFGEPAVPVLTSLLRSADPEIVGRSAASLRRIGTDAALDALAVALNADDIRYRDQMLEAGLGVGPIPERVGRALPGVADLEVRRSVIRSALLTNTPQHWLVDLVREHAWAREAAFRKDRQAWTGLGWLTEMVVAAGPGPARDAAIAHMRLYEADRPKRDWTFTGAKALASPSAEFLRDREAVDVVAHHVLCDYRGQRSAALRDGVLADPRNRGIAMEWTWRDKMPCTNRELFLNALAENWHFDMRRLSYTVAYEVLRASFDPPLTGAEWTRILRGEGALAADPYLVFGSSTALTADVLDAFLGVGRVMSVLQWIDQHGVPDTEWAARALPPMLDSEDEAIVRSAARHLVQLHRAGDVDMTPHATRLVELLREGRVGRDVLAHGLEMGTAGPDAVAASFGVPEDDDAWFLMSMWERNLPQTADAARRVLFATVEDDTKQAQQSFKTAARVLVQVAGDDAVPDMLRAVRMEPASRRIAANNAIWPRTPGLTSDGLARYVTGIVESAPDVPADVAFPRHAGSLDDEAQRRLSLAALRTESPMLRIWGAQRQKEILDPEAAQPLAAMAASNDRAQGSVARRVLADLRQAQQDLAWIRAVAARDATRQRVNELLESASVNERMAGIAGLVALRAPDALERLLEVAAADRDADVRAEARRALMAVGAWEGGTGNKGGDAE